MSDSSERKVTFFYWILFYSITVFNIVLCPVLYIVPLLHIDGKTVFRALLNHEEAGESSSSKVYEVEIKMEKWRVMETQLC